LHIFCVYIIRLIICLTHFCRYCSMTYIVDQLFPPVKHDEVAVEFSNFNYWRDPIVNLPELETAVVPTTVTTKPEIATLRPIPEKWNIYYLNTHTYTYTTRTSTRIFIYLSIIYSTWSFLSCCNSWIIYYIRLYSYFL